MEDSISWAMDSISLSLMKDKEDIARRAYYLPLLAKLLHLLLVSFQFLYTRKTLASQSTIIFDVFSTMPNKLLLVLYCLNTDQEFPSWRLLRRYYLEQTFLCLCTSCPLVSSGTEVFPGPVALSSYLAAVTLLS